MSPARLAVPGALLALCMVSPGSASAAPHLAPEGNPASPRSGQTPAGTAPLLDLKPLDAGLSSTDLESVLPTDLSRFPAPAEAEDLVSPKKELALGETLQRREEAAEADGLPAEGAFDATAALPGGPEADEIPALPPASVRFTRQFFQAAGKVPGLRGDQDSGAEGKLWHRLRLDIAALLEDVEIDGASLTRRGEASEAGVRRFKWTDGNRRSKLSRSRRRARSKGDFEPPNGIRVIFHWDKDLNVLTFLDVRHKSDILNYRDQVGSGQDRYYDKMAERARWRDRFVIDSARANALADWLLEEPAP